MFKKIVINAATGVVIYDYHDICFTSLFFQLIVVVVVVLLLS